MKGGLGSLLSLAAVLAAVLVPGPARAHPLGNFSISHYTALRVEPDRISITYVIDMAEIPTFQELQSKGLVPDPSHPSVASYLRPAIEALGAGLQLEVNGAQLILHARSSGVVFPPGAGDLPTMRMEALYQASLDRVGLREVNELSYRDENFTGRAGWKEIVAVAGPRTSLARSSVPEQDRSHALTDYPTDLLDSPPQDVEARLLFSLTTVAATGTIPSPPPFDTLATRERTQKPTIATVAPVRESNDVRGVGRPRLDCARRWGDGPGCKPAAHSALGLHSTGDGGGAELWRDRPGHAHRSRRGSRSRPRARTRQGGGGGVSRRITRDGMARGVLGAGGYRCSHGRSLPPRACHPLCFPLHRARASLPVARSRLWSNDCRPWRLAVSAAVRDMGRAGAPSPPRRP